MALSARSQLRLMEVEGHSLDYNSPLSHAALPPANPVKITDWLVRNQLWIFIGVAFVYLLAFSGDWRVGRDSALYRGLGHTLATGRGFAFSEFGKRQIYPGLPLLLAGLEKVFGPTPLAPVLLIHALALGCLITTYKLVSLRYAQWLAVCVTALVGVNGWFLELTNEILTDIPFLFGLLLALYGWERLRLWGVGERPTGDASHDIERAQRHPWLSLFLLLIGLAVAAVMRPTFWILAIAWVVVCVWGLMVGPGRRFYAICLGILLAVWVSALMADPRVKGFNPLGGGYERDAIRSLHRASATIAKQLPEMLGGELSYAFFGQKWGPGLTEILCLAVLCASLLLFRVNPLWPLLILLTVATTLVMTTVPRYYIMVLPLMLLGWFTLAFQVARHVSGRWTDLVLALAIAMVFIPGLSRCIKVIGEQHHLNRSAREDDGEKWKYVQDMAEVVRQSLPENAKLVGPAATIMSYVSGREVFMQRELLPDNVPPEQYPAYLEKSGIQYAVFPPTLYRKGERVIRDLMEHGVIVPVERVGKTKDMVLARVAIAKPAGDWRKSPAVDVMTARGIRTVATSTQPAVVKPKKTLTPSQVRKLAKAKKTEKLQKTKRKAAAARRARRMLRAQTTQPSR